MQMTAQEVFNRGYLGTIKQGDTCSDNHGSCFYRHPTKPGFACVVGQLIDDETAYDFNNHYRGGEIESIPNDELPYELRPHHDLLVEMQHAHDRASVKKTAKERIKEFIIRMTNVAIDFELEVPKT